MTVFTQAFQLLAKPTGQLGFADGNLCHALQVTDDAACLETVFRSAAPGLEHVTNLSPDI